MNFQQRQGISYHIFFFGGKKTTEVFYCYYSKLCKRHLLTALFSWEHTEAHRAFGLHGQHELVCGIHHL